MAKHFALLTHLPGSGGKRSQPKTGKSFLLYRKLAAQLTPIKAMAEISVSNLFSGWLIGCPWNYDDNFRLPWPVVRRQLACATEKAKQMGANILGWPAGSCFPAWMAWLAHRYTLPILTGQALDIYASIELIKNRIAGFRMPGSRLRVLINPVNDPNTVVLARLLAREYRYLTLAGDNEPFLARVADQIWHETGVVCGIKLGFVPDKDFDLICRRDLKGVSFTIRTGKQELEWRKVWFSVPWKLDVDKNSHLKLNLVDACAGETILYSYLNRPDLCYCRQPLTVRAVETFGKIAREHDFTPRETSKDFLIAPEYDAIPLSERSL